MYQLRNRHGETGTVQPRIERFYNISDEWWFAIRRGPDQGPYPTRAASRKALIEYINDQIAFEKRMQQDYVQLNYQHY
ncbi:DUF6316 family protein [Thiohalophilus thiocyanatoxydans]|uniref:DUF6316 domain-containing protein n=1 Tax=Thiohalophilus thiocyanatoxydans TaxID=381308 RepID=A0A4R8IKJ9_9GAMM|nr:hypothetical protein EDC23_2118 [Thiohalophilus thiocyanatoxydans]